MAESKSSSNMIIVAMDGSRPALNAATLAIQIARPQKLSIRGVYVVDQTLVLDMYANYGAELGGGEEPPASRSELIAKFEEHGALALSWLASRCQEADVTFSRILQIGDVAEVTRAEATAASLLALGRRGHTHEADAQHLGRNFRAIAPHSRQPLLIGGDEQRPLRRMLLAYNGSDRAQHALEWAARLQGALLAEVVVVTVQEDSQPTQSWREEARTRLTEFNVASSRFLQRRGQAAAEIVAAAAEAQVDLIVMGGYRHTTILEWIVGSTVDHVLRSSPLPALVI